MITTKYGTRIEIIGTYTPFKSNGKSYPQVVTENIDEQSIMYGNVEIMLVENLREKRRGEIEEAIEKIRKGVPT